MSESRLPTITEQSTLHWVRPYRCDYYEIYVEGVPFIAYTGKTRWKYPSTARDNFFRQLVNSAIVYEFGFQPTGAEVELIEAQLQQHIRTLVKKGIIEPRHIKRDGTVTTWNLVEE